MAKVLCTLPNASEEISGIKFKQVDGGMLSEDISDEDAANFVSINGYELVGEKKEATAANTKQPQKTKEEKAAEKAAAAEKELADKEAAEAQAKQKETDDGKSRSSFPCFLSRSHG